MPHRAISRTPVFRFALAGFTLAACLAMAAPALAGGGPSVENCRNRGTIDMDCYVCMSGRYLGKVTIQAEYDPYYGDCFNNIFKARDMCKLLYDAGDGEMATKGRYSIGGGSYTAWTPSKCVH